MARFGNRGVQTIELKVYGANAPLHSGHYGNFALSSAYEGDGGSLQPILLRAMGGTVPTWEISAPLKLPFVLPPRRQCRQ